MALPTHSGPRSLIQFHKLSYTDGSTPWTSDQPLAGLLPKHRTTETQNKRIHTQNVHALSGMRTHDPSIQASENSSCFRPLANRDRQLTQMGSLKKHSPVFKPESKCAVALSVWICVQELLSSNPSRVTCCRDRGVLDTTPCFSGLISRKYVEIRYPPPYIPHIVNGQEYSGTARFEYRPGNCLSLLECVTNFPSLSWQIPEFYLI
jgi:hypothetical protein